MERLTERHGDTVRLNGRSLAEASTADIVKMAERLATYEDTCLEPWQADAAKSIVEMAFEDKPERAERIRDLMRADKEGRIVVLPCKVGDTVYMIERIFDIDNGVCDEICARKVIGHGGNNLNKLWLIGSGGICNVSIFASEFGKTVFLTREEAEKALCYKGEEL